MRVSPITAVAIHSHCAGARASGAAVVDSFGGGLTSAISTGAFSAFVAGTSSCDSGCGGTATTGGGRTRIDDRVTVDVEADV